MLVDEKLKLLRKQMKDKGIDAYIIPSSDAHQSEYVAEHWRSRAWISGFTGSAGTVVITTEKSGLWTDGRYFLQAEKQLEGTEIKLFKMRQPNVPTYIEWLESVLPEGACVGFDDKVFSWTQVKELEESFAQKEIKINGEFDLVDVIWEDRQDIPISKVYIHDTKYAGKSIKEKLDLVRGEMKKKGAQYYLLSSLDDIAWLFNIRGNDVKNNPVVISYALISEEKAMIFVDQRKVTKEVIETLKNNGVDLKGYYEVKDILLTGLKEGSGVFFDPSKTSRWLYNSIPSGCEKIEGKDITTQLKAIKNEVEIENLKNCQVKDGVAMVKFLHWLDENVEKEEITEISATEKLEAFRREQDKFIETSFDTIGGYKEHAAMMHYSATEKTKYTLKAEGMFLVDSGGQYLDGTTDITRTIILGPISEEEKHDFTLVLKGHIALSRIKFLYGATGSNLDILARQPLWEEGIDYKCGTGHGVGFLLNVHEGPQRFSQDYNDTKLEKGMIITNEPGIYKEGKHGIRTENVLLVVEDEQTEFGQFMRFEGISYCPIDLEGIDIDMLNDKEKTWLNEYHKKIYNLLSTYLNEDERKWLKRKTREI
ncbi:aminopeptidase P family protein [Clostridium ganghwense]|uniref:Aminopeptidase P family protein n=1 Tax=Clostridium ganghwense TaxID=312089 RepID=A0ABT4CKK2_9CLOT|nr:aminopeptidase P family protein [Clostridium ganghwense]MCY6369579.1 aminopeptidase P family protein [Clostridium ganghwense]